MADGTFGNSGTTILFSVLVAAGSVVILCILFMSSRHMFRSRFGLYDPVVNATIPQHSFAGDPNTFESMNQPYIIYGGRTFYLHDSNFTGSRNVNRVDILTEPQLEKLFPFQTYKEWNNGGKEELQERNKGVVGYIDEIKKNDDNNDKSVEENNDSLHIVEVDITEMKTHDGDFELKNFVDTKHEKHFDSGICAICLDDLVDDDVVRGLICGHVFHKVCIDPWLTKRKGFCPTCKRELYLHEQQQQHSIGQVVGGEDPIIEPGSQELDEILNVNQNNNEAFFLVASITQFKANTLLAALECLKLNRYTVEQRMNNNNNNEDDLPPRVDRSIRHFNQPLIEEDDTPPRPDINHLNKRIMEILNRSPRPFHPADLQDIDHLAFEMTNNQYRGIKKLYFKWIDIKWIDIYYLNVVKIYERQRHERLNL